MNDKQSLELLKQQRLQERQYEIEKAELEQATKLKEIERTRANSKKMNAEI